MSPSPCAISPGKSPSRPCQTLTGTASNRIVQRIGREPVALRRRHLSTGWRFALAGAVAAVAAGAVLTIEHVSSKPDGAEAMQFHSRTLSAMLSHNSSSEKKIDAAALVVGDELLADVAGAKIERNGQFSFELDLSSELGIEALSDHVVVSLKTGTVHVHVTPAQMPESFVVRVGHTNVAVHGTTFTVSRHGDSGRVDVTEGTVVVGPHTRGTPTTGWLVVGPSAGSFSLDGAKTASFSALPVAPLISTNRRLTLRHRLLQRSLLTC